MIDQINASCEYLRSRGILRPEVGVILGTGLGESFVRAIADPVIVPYKDIPHFPLPTMSFHKGNLIYGAVGGKTVLAMEGRFHYYEGYSMQQITFPVRVMRMLGVSSLLISNAGGNMNPQWNKGEFMLIDDHINLHPDNPLRGIDQSLWNNPFPDMSQPYSREINEKLISLAASYDIRLRRGVYVAVTGPSLETRAEYRFLRTIGADVVGMSTVPEVIVANHMNLPCCAISVLTDDCDPSNLKPVNIEEIIAVAKQAEPALTKLFTGLIAEL